MAFFVKIIGIKTEGYQKIEVKQAQIVDEKGNPKSKTYALKEFAKDIYEALKNAALGTQAEIIAVNTPLDIRRLELKLATASNQQGFVNLNQIRAEKGIEVKSQKIKDNTQPQKQQASNKSSYQKNTFIPTSSKPLADNNQFFSTKLIQSSVTKNDAEKSINPSPSNAKKAKRFVLQKFASRQANSDVQLNNQNVKLENLGLANPILGARKDASFEAKGKNKYRLVSYGKDIETSCKLKNVSIDDNPYNFAEWETVAPNDSSDSQKKKSNQPTPWIFSEHPEYLNHDREQEISGKISLTYQAQSPIFIPDTKYDKVQENFVLDEDFVTMWNGQSDQKAIPGSSIKGAIRSLLEILSNSRCGVTDMSLYQFKDQQNRLTDLPMVYRRSSGKLYKIKNLPRKDVDGKEVNGEVIVCEYKGLRTHPGNYKLKGQSAIIEEFKANLFYVSSAEHKHKNQYIAYIETKDKIALSYEVWQQYLKLKDHPHLRQHIHNAMTPSEPYYKKTPTYDSNTLNALFNLKSSDLIFGITNNKKDRLVCFGRNTYFLWPAKKTPRKLFQNFEARSAQANRFENSDMAERLFGFIGDERTQGKSYKGRVKFSPFWLVKSEGQYDPIQLMPLVSPSGAKLKSRPLYLQPSSDKKNRDGLALSGDYSDDKVALKGRKMYWHQKANDDGIPMVHQYQQPFLEENIGGPNFPNDKLLPPKIKPLKTGAEFEGEIQFHNLTSEELGTLLVSLDPNLAFDVTKQDTYGLKIGKGKPLGLGSIKVTKLELKILKSAQNRYVSLENDLYQIHKPDDYVENYKKWAEQQSGKKWGDLLFVKDLSTLLKLPKETNVKVYPPSFDMCSWMPDFESSTGEPKDGRPIAMRQARDF